MTCRTPESSKQCLDCDQEKLTRDNQGEREKRPGQNERRAGAQSGTVCRGKGEERPKRPTDRVRIEAGKGVYRGRMRADEKGENWAELRVSSSVSLIAS